MPTQQQIRFLVERAQKESDAKVQQLAQARNSLASAEAKLGLLSRYREDYQTQLGVTVSQGTNGDQLRNFQRFIGNIAQAIDQQTREVERRRVVVQRTESAWRETQRRLQSYRTLAERAASQTRLKEERKQQKENDEFATKNFLQLVGKA